MSKEKLPTSISTPYFPRRSDVWTTQKTIWVQPSDANQFFKDLHKAGFKGKLSTFTLGSAGQQLSFVVLPKDYNDDDLRKLKVWARKRAKSRSEAR